MADQNSDSGPSTGAETRRANGHEEAYAAAFKLVQNEIRLAVVRELAQAQATDPYSPALRFSTIRGRLGNPDSGTFNYRLNRLQG